MVLGGMVTLSGNCESYPKDRRNKKRLRLPLVRQQQTLRLYREGCCRVILVVWTMSTFHVVLFLSCSMLVRKWSCRVL